MAIRPLTLDQVLDVERDIADVTRYLMLFGKIPGSTDSSGLTVKCYDTQAPGVVNQSYDVRMGGHAVNFRGAIDFGGHMSFAFYVDGNGDTLEQIQSWHERVVGTQSGNSAGYVDDYAVTATLCMFDSAGEEYCRYTIYRLYPTDIQAITLSSGGSQAVAVNVNCRFAYHATSTRTLL